MAGHCPSFCDCTCHSAQCLQGSPCWGVCQNFIPFHGQFLGKTTFGLSRHLLVDPWSVLFLFLSFLWENRLKYSGVCLSFVTALNPERKSPSQGPVTGPHTPGCPQNVCAHFHSWQLSFENECILINAAFIIMQRLCIQFWGHSIYRVKDTHKVPNCSNDLQIRDLEQNPNSNL